MNEDFLDLLSALLDADVRFMIVGAYAVGVAFAAFGGLKADVRTSVGALKESIEVRDFRLDEHGRRLNKLEG